MSTKIPILSVYDENGNRVEVPAIRGKSAYQYAKDGGYTGTEEEFAEKQAQVIPDSLPASDVYTWAKQPNKPSYTANEVGAASKEDVEQLSEEIADLPNEYVSLTALEGDSTTTVIKRLTADDFGTFTLNPDGTNYIENYNDRVATRLLLSLANSPITIDCPSPYAYIVYFYNTDTATSEGYLGKTSFVPGSTSDVRALTIASGTMDGATHCRISLRDSTNTSADLSSRIDEFVQNVYITQSIKKIGDPLIAKSEWVRDNFSTTEEMEEYVVEKIAEAQLGDRKLF